MPFIKSIRCRNLGRPVKVNIDRPNKIKGLNAINNAWSSRGATYAQGPHENILKFNPKYIVLISWIQQRPECCTRQHKQVNKPSSTFNHEPPQQPWQIRRVQRDINNHKRRLKFLKRTYPRRQATSLTTRARAQGHSSPTPQWEKPS